MPLKGKDSQDHSTNSDALCPHEHSNRSVTSLDTPYMVFHEAYRLLYRPCLQRVLTGIVAYFEVFEVDDQVLCYCDSDGERHYHPWAPAIGLEGKCGRDLLQQNGAYD